MRDVRSYRTRKERRILEQRKYRRAERVRRPFDANEISRGHWKRVKGIQQKKRNGIALSKAERISLLSFYRKSLYHNPTDAEIGMGMLLNILNIKCIFQKQFGCYIVDYFLPVFDIVIEVDGPQHYINNEVITYDAKRSNYLLSRGIEVIRFTNERLINDYISVAEGIVDAITKSIASKETALKMLKINADSLIERKS